MTTRRQFLRTSSMAAVAAAIGVPSAAQAEFLLLHPPPVGHLPRAGDPTLRELAMRALDAAKAAGATYADVRMTVTRKQAFYYASPPYDSENIAIGVRALADGAWGFSAGPDWTAEDLARLGREAVAQAKANVWSGRPPVELGDALPAGEGEWRMPIQRDPLDIAIEEKLDYIRSAEAYAATFRNGGATSVIVFQRQERTFASTEGAFYTQTVYNSLGESFFAVGVSDPVTQRGGGVGAPFVSPTGSGYEIFTENKLLDQIPELYERARLLLTGEPLQFPERFEVAFDGYAMANIVRNTLGAPLELDRALGLEANASGTSYIAPPESLLGTNVASADVTLTANRSAPTGAASVKWDDDGITPRDFTMIRNGVLMDYATTRELAPTLGDWYRKSGQPLASNGCASSDDAMTMPIVHSPNLELHPGRTNASFDDLIKQIDNGIAVRGGWMTMDQQFLNGQGSGELVHRVRKGKIVGTLSGAGFLIRSPDLWKDLVALGGAQSAATRGISVEKGQPQQATVHTIKSVAALFRNVRVVDLRALNPAGPTREMMLRGIQTQ